MGTQASVNVHKHGIALSISCRWTTQAVSRLTTCADVLFMQDTYLPCAHVFGTPFILILRTGPALMPSTWQ